MKKNKKSKLSHFMKDLFFGGKGPDLQEDRLFRLLEINTLLNSELNLKRLLTLILDSVIELLGAEQGFIITNREARSFPTQFRSVVTQTIAKHLSAKNTSDFPFFYFWPCGHLYRSSRNSQSCHRSSEYFSLSCSKRRVWIWHTLDSET